MVRMNSIASIHFYTYPSHGLQFTPLSSSNSWFLLTDSPNFEIVEAKLPKVQKSSNMVPNMIPNKDQEVDNAPTHNKSGLSDTIQKSHEDACNETIEECLQMTPPDSDIYNKPNLNKTPEVLLKITGADTVKSFSNENIDSVSSSNPVIFSILCSNMATFTL